MNTYLVPLENLIVWVREASGASLFPLLIGGTLLVLLLILAIDRGNDGDGDGNSDAAAPREARRDRTPAERSAAAGADHAAPVARTASPGAVPPAAAVSPPPGATTPDWEPAPSPAAAVPTSARVLVVDDSAVVRLKLRRLLEGAGYTVEVARNGIEALEVLPKAFVSVLVTDLEMPDMSGLELIASVHGSIETEDLPIIAITGHDELQSRVHDYAGLYGLFRKPWNDRDLLKRIEALAPLRRHADHPLVPLMPFVAAAAVPAGSPLAGG